MLKIRTFRLGEAQVHQLPGKSQEESRRKGGRVLLRLLWRRSREVVLNISREDLSSQARMGGLLPSHLPAGLFYLLRLFILLLFLQLLVVKESTLQDPGTFSFISTQFIFKERNLSKNNRLRKKNKQLKEEKF